MKTIKEYLKNHPTIGDYAFIGDCHSAALVSRYGSIDWCCMPRIDSASCFGRLLSWRTAGFCQIVPTNAFNVSRCYDGETMVLKTIFHTETGDACIYDFFAMRKGGSHNPYQQLIRVLECTKGSVELQVDMVPRYDYGTVKPWIKPYKKSAFAVLGGSNGLLVSGNMPLILKDRHHLFANLTLHAKQRSYLALTFSNPENLDDNIVQVPSIVELDYRLDETIKWWSHWIRQGKYAGAHEKLLYRSALVLKCLSNAPTGAIAAAATTSLPESRGGIRNWDYRFSWIRDSYLSVRSLAVLGFIKEADGFRRFIERSSHSSSEGLQTLYGVYGERRLEEYEIPELDGYRGAKPVRIGNEAAKQLQLDMYGSLLDLAWGWHLRGSSPEREYWLFLEHIVNFVQEQWQNPDFGIWEMRVEPRHFTHSKVMCWVALDRGIRMAEELGHKTSLQAWKATRHQLREYIETQCYDSKRGVFIHAPGFSMMDSALLLLPMYGFLDYKDERVVRTIAQIRKELEVDGLLRRYPLNIDGLEGEEGAFLACTFWLVTCLAHQGKKQLAKKFFKRAILTQNDLGLFSEEYDVKHEEMLGNFPQAFTHLSLIIAALALENKDS